MVSLNGRLDPSELTTVEGNIPLAKKTANAYLNMKAAAKAAGIDIWIAQPIGGYRSFDVQADMHVHPEKYGLSTVSVVNIAGAGYSTHGLGNTVDIGSFGSIYGTAGAKRSDWLIQHAAEFGFFREFGDKDPNHFHHDGFTAVGSPVVTSGTSGTKITPIPPAPKPPVVPPAPVPIPEDSPMITVHITKHSNPAYNGWIGTIGTRFAKHWLALNSAQYFANVTQTSDTILQVDEIQFNTLLDGFGVPRDVVPLKGGIWVG